MSVLKTKVGGDWVPLVAGRDGAQGKPGPASPHEGSNIAVGVRQYGAVGDGTTDDTAAVQAAINAAGSYGFVDFEAGTYKVTSGLSSWLNIRKTGPGVLTDGTVQQYVTPRYDGDVVALYVDGASGSDLADGLFPHSAFKTLGRLREAFEKMDAEQVQRGQVIVRLSGTITGGMRFQDLPAAKLFIRFEGAALDTAGRPTTWIVNDAADAERFGLRFEEGQNQRIHLARLGFRGFNSGGGMGWLMKSGGFIRTEDCWTEDCQIGSGYVGNVGFSEQRSVHQGYTTSGTRAQYSASGTWTECDMLGGPNATEGFHVSRNAVAHVDKCTAQDHQRSGLWIDMASRVSSAGSTYYRNGWYGIRGEGQATVHVDDSTYGANVFGTGANANGFKDVSLTGDAQHSAIEGIYSIPENLVDAQAVNSTTDVQMRNGRGMAAYRIGRGARMRVRTWGTGAGTVAVKFGATTVRTVTVTGTWLIELTAMHDDGTAWQIISTLNGAGPTIQSVPSVRAELRPVISPTGTTVRGVEFYTGG